MSIAGDMMPRFGIKEAIGGGVGGFLAGGPIGAIGGVVTGLLGGGSPTYPLSPQACEGLPDIIKKLTGCPETRGAPTSFPRPPSAPTDFPIIPISGPVDQVLTPQPPQEKPPIRVGPISINPPLTGPPGIGVTFDPFGGQSTNGGAATMPQNRLPMMGQIAVQPAAEQRVVRKCPKGYRLAVDGLCYSKSILGRTSKLRMWPATPKPPISRADVKALQRIDTVRKRVKDMARKADLTCRKR